MQSVSHHVVSPVPEGNGKYRSLISIHKNSLANNASRIELVLSLHTVIV